MSDGKECTCATRSAYECYCEADWTPEEVYKLRAENAELREEIAEWKCDVQRRDDYMTELEAENAALAEQNAKMRKKLASIRRYGLDTLSGRTDGPDDREWQRARVNEMTKRANITDIPDLSTPAINRIKSEAYRECAEICREKVKRVSNGNGISYQSFDPASVMAEYCEETIRAAADELEGKK